MRGGTNPGPWALQRHVAPTPQSGALVPQTGKTNLLPTPTKPLEGEHRGGGGTPEAQSRTTVVLDTNVLLADPETLFGYPGTDVVITGTVLRELGRKKTDLDLGHAARAVLRSLQQYLVGPGITSTEPQTLPHGGTVRLVPNGIHTELLEAAGYAKSQSDVRIVGACVGLKDAGREVRLVTNDVEMQLLASIAGIETEEYVHSEEVEASGAGWCEIEVHDSGVIDSVYHDGHLPLAHPSLGGYEVAHNQGVLLKAAGTKQSVILRRKGPELVKVETEKIYLDDNKRHWFSAKNVEQRVALAMLLDPDIPIVSLVGMAGTGKTISAIAAGLHQIVHPDRSYTRMGIYRPVSPVGRGNDIGYVPGSASDKILEWHGASLDSLSALFSKGENPLESDRIITGLQERGQLEFGSIGHIRGRSIRNTFIILDEAQAVDPAIAKVICTRLGEGSKIVFTGDVTQVDNNEQNPYVTRNSNALAALIDRLGGEELFGHVILTKGERSKVAELAARLM